MVIVSICQDMEALRATGLVDAESPYRGKIDGRSGKHVQYSPDGTKSMIVITSIDELEGLAELPFVTVTSLEEIHGYKKQVEIDGELQWTEEVVTVPAYTPQVVVGYVDGDPVYKVVRHDKQKTVTRTHDEDGNELPEPIEAGVVKTRNVYGEDGELLEVIETPVMVLDYYETTDEIEGYKQVPVYGDGEEVPESSYTVKHPVLEEVAGDPALKALYDEIYPRTPYVDEEGNVHTPPKLFAVPGGQDTSHIL
jgi:hypothetical protein